MGKFETDRVNAAIKYLEKIVSQSHLKKAEKTDPHKYIVAYGGAIGTSHAALDELKKLFPLDKHTHKSENQNQ